MSKSLRLCIRKTNKHIYLYLLDNHQQLIMASTDCKHVKKELNIVDTRFYPELVANILAQKMMDAGLIGIQLTFSAVYHGKIQTIISVLRTRGIDIC